MFQTMRRQPARIAPEAWAARISPTVSPANPVYALLSADVFDPVAANRLAHRHQYAAAADRLQDIAGVGGSLIPALADQHSPFAPFRFGHLFGAVPWDVHLERPYTVADLRASSASEASLALIALGVECDWTAMCRRGRAIFALRYLVATLRRTM